MRRLGIGLGQMEIQLNGQHFNLGQVVEGELLFHLPDPTEANVLTMDVQAYHTTSAPHTSQVYRDGQYSHSTTSQNSRRHVHFSAHLQLDGPRTYYGGVYPFRLKLPHRLQETGPRNDLERLVEVASMFKHGLATSRSPVLWEISAKLEIPWSAGLAKSVRLQVFEGHPDIRPEYRGAPGFELPRMPNCPTCGTPSHPRHGCIRCQEARGEAPPQPAPPLPAVAAGRPPKKFCGQCGDRRQPENNFCESCGHRYD